MGVGVGGLGTTGEGGSGTGGGASGKGGGGSGTGGGGSGTGGAASGTRGGGSGDGGSGEGGSGDGDGGDEKTGERSGIGRGWSSVACGCWSATDCLLVSAFEYTDNTSRSCGYDVSSRT